MWLNSYDANSGISLKRFRSRDLRLSGLCCSVVPEGKVGMLGTNMIGVFSCK